MSAEIFYLGVRGSASFHLRKPPVRDRASGCVSSVRVAAGKGTIGSCFDGMLMCILSLFGSNRVFGFLCLSSPQVRLKSCPSMRPELGSTVELCDLSPHGSSVCDYLDDVNECRIDPDFSLPILCLFALSFARSPSYCLSPPSLRLYVLPWG